MLNHSFSEPAPHPFDFEATVRSHGWAALHPFVWDAETAALSRIHRLHSGKVVQVHMQSSGRDSAPAVHVAIRTPAALAPGEIAEISRAVRRMLRLDEDLSEFHDLHANMAGWSLQVSAGGGRLLRCPSLFEDIVYTLCTTNIAWSGTKRMVRLLVETLGDRFPGEADRRAFPTPAAIAATSPDFLRSEIGLGYRSAYLWDLATAVAQKRLDLRRLEDPARPTEEVRRALLQIKGIGNYAAATILMLLGRYEHLAIDTELRSLVTQKYFGGEAATEAEIHAIYAPWGRWRYLAYWFDPPAEGL